jgi:pimeloyl-ACP methyl ester carboxylesterase
MKLRAWLKIAMAALLGLFLNSCFLLNKYIYTDKELEERYKNSTTKPQYKNLKFLNRNLHYTVVSKNDSLPLLIFLHGAPGAWYGYMNLMDDSLLQQRYKMIAVDRLGYGKSDYGKPELSTQLQALAVKTVIETENTSRKKVHVLGRSYGAPIAAWLAINYPQLTERLFMISPVIDPDHEKFYWFSSIGKWKPVKWLLPKLLNVATDEKYAHPLEMKQMKNKWNKLYTTTYVICGENDRIADTANYSFAKRNIINSDATFLKLKNTGHLVTYEKAGFIKELLLKTD